MWNAWAICVFWANLTPCSLKAANLLPVVVMFDEFESSGELNAIFFASSDRQQSLFPPSSNQWEAVALPNVLMCKNFCDAHCTFHDTSLFSTLHLYFRDYQQVSCKSDCQVGCCPGTTAVSTLPTKTDDMPPPGPNANTPSKLSHGP